MTTIEKPAIASLAKTPDEMKHLTEQQSNGALVDGLTLLVGLTGPEYRLTASVIVDVLAARSPWVQAALDAWERDMETTLTTTEVALYAAKRMRRTARYETRGPVDVSRAYPTNS